MRAIIVKFQAEGIHCFPEAPNEVAYLRQPHRHMFHFEVTLEVFHNDREIEFILLKNELQWEMKQYLNTQRRLWEHPRQGEESVLPRFSCEDLAEYLAKYINRMYPAKFPNGKRRKRAGAIEVYEDDENGAVLSL